MGNWDAAVMAMIGISAIGFLLADGEKRRLFWVMAMRRCLVRLGDVIRYDRSGLCALLRGIDLRATQQEKELTRLLHACADRLEEQEGMPLLSVFAAESARVSSFGVTSGEDRAAFEGVLAELGRCGLREQLRLIDEADERLRAREEALRREGTQRARLIRTLGLCCGAAVFLVLI